MTKKHYIAIARSLSDTSERFGSVSDRAIVMEVARGLADVLGAENPRFDRDRFLAACAPGAL